VFAAVMSQALRMAGIPPDAPETQLREAVAPAPVTVAAKDRG
jgi:hypothetical protein